jgi:aminopeptidase N
MDEYFRRHDGQAVTCDDFVEAMDWALQRANPGRNLEQFKRWYSQAGTPRVTASLVYDDQAQRCSLTLTQQCPPVGVEKQANAPKLPFHIPIIIGLLDAEGTPFLLGKDPQTGTPLNELMLELTQETQTWVFEHLASKPTPSLLRHFSAPVNLIYPYSSQELALLSSHDQDAFARWESGQELANRQILSMAADWRQTGQTSDPDPVMLKAWGAMLQNKALDAGYLARALSLPMEKTVLERMDEMDPVAVSQARSSLKRMLGQYFRAELIEAYHSNATPGRYSPAPVASGRRALKNLALSYLVSAQDGEAIDFAFQQFNHATNMTDRMAALGALVHETHEARTSDALSAFYENWQHDPLVIDKWFAVQASSPQATIEDMLGLMAHPAFTLRNPNRARSVIFQFCVANLRGLHAADGSGYRYWADQVLTLDALNPEIAARLARAFDHWARFIPAVRDSMQRELKRVAAQPNLSRNTLEIISKALAL